jgi:hypothetical protein
VQLSSRTSDPENDNNPGIVEETGQYIRNFDRLAETTRTAQELYDKMLEIYPNRVNPGGTVEFGSRRQVMRTDF